MATEKTSSCAYVLGDDGLARLSDLHAEAWIGLLETHKRLTRALDAELEARYGLTLTSVEVLGRLAAADDRRLRLTELAGLVGLSLSRISRVIDTLQDRGLVERLSSASDARAVDAHLTDEGLALAREAQGSHFASVDERFFGELSQDELETLAAVFSRLAPRTTADCRGAE
jgi:DNA-binding MarR family transcriptional regulator